MNDVRQFIPKAIAERIRWETMRPYDVLIQQATTIAGGTGATGNSDPYTLESGYYFLWLGTSGDVYTPAALSVASGGVITSVGQRYLWEPDDHGINSANNTSYAMPHVGQFGVKFRINAETLASGFVPFHLFAGPSAAQMRLNPVPIGLIGQTPVAYELQNNAPANCGARSNIVLHTLRFAL